MHLTELMPSITRLIDYEYDAIRNPAYDALIQAHLEAARPVELPQFVQVSGIPGAGKSTFIANRDFSDFFILSFDKIMLSIPQYDADVKKHGLVQAFATWEMPARVIGYEILKRALLKKADIVLEHSGTNPAHVELFKALPQLGYRTHVHFLLCDLDVALERVKRRADFANRHISKEIVTQRFVLVQQYIQEYEKITGISIYDPKKRDAALHPLTRLSHPK
ncbi:MAG: zeta toxin family protein [Alphaproteobacteria bacterium]|nr:zeta toxin family protein [Alphaproteobacteria bacterium]